MYIRSGHKEDCPAIAQLLIQSWQKHYRSFIKSEVLSSLSVDKQIMRHENYMLKGTLYKIACTDDHSLIGFCSLGMSRNQKHPIDTEIYTLYVDHTYQRQGIANQLLTMAIEEYNGKGGKVLVSVFSANPCKNFYYQYGFVPYDAEVLEIGDQQIETEILEYAGRSHLAMDG